MNIRLSLCIAFFWFSFSYFKVEAQTLSSERFDAEITEIKEDIEQLGIDTDAVNDTQDASIAELSQDIDQLRKQLDQYQAEYDRLQEALEASENFQATISGLEGRVSSANKRAEDAFSAANFVRWIVTVTAFLITSLTAILGLMFSSRFTDLKADAKVAQEVLARVEKRVENTKGLTETLARLEARIASLSETSLPKNSN